MTENRARQPRKALITWTVLTGILCVAIGASAEQGRAESNVNVSSLIRPQVISLNGDWHFREDPKNVGEAEEWFKPGAVRGRVSPVAMPWQLAFEDLREYLGTAWYEKDFKAPEDSGDKRVAVQFVGVDHSCKIWVNGEAVGEHVGDLTSFTLDISRQVRPGENNTVTLKVTDPEVGTRFWDSEQVIAFSGLWRDVYLEITGKTYVSDVYMVPDIDRGRAEARIEIVSTLPTAERDLTAMVEAKAPDGRKFTQRVKVHVPKNDLPVSVKADAVIGLGKCVLWDPDNPALYEVTVSLIDERGSIVDQATTHFGMRKIEARGKHIYLNNSPIYLIGGWLDPSPLAGPDEVNWAMPYPYKPLSDEEIKRDIELAKSMGINTLRRLLRSINPRFLYWADRLGMLVWEGGPWVPRGGITSRDVMEQYKKGWTDIVLRDRNHPSVIVREIFCENIGLGGGEYDTWDKTTEMLAELYDHVKGLDPTSLVLDNAGGRSHYTINYIGNHGKTDLDDVCYLGAASESWIQGVDAFRKYCAEISEHGKPVTNSLLHNISSRVVDADKARRVWGGREPWWFVAPPGIEADSTKLTGFEERFYKWGLDEVFGDFPRFTELNDWYLYEGVKYQAEQMRMNPDMSGYLSFLFDCVPHFIGAVDVFRDKKVFCGELSKIYTQDLVILDCKRRNFWSGETVRGDVYFSHFGKGKAKGCVARWWLEGFDIKGEVGNVSVEIGDVKRVGGIEFKAPDVTESKSVRLKVRVERGGEVLSENCTTVQVFPLKYREPKVRRINVYGGTSGLTILSGPTMTRFDVAGYDRSAPLAKGTPVALATTMDEHVLEYLRDGGTVILLVCDELDLMGFRPKLAIHPAEGFLRQHNLVLAGQRFHFGGITGSHFVRKDRGLFERIPFENPIAWPFYRVAPERVLVYVKPEARSDILAGTYGSFVRSSPVDSAGNPHPSEISATIAQFRYGKGRLIISTFNLLEPLGDDPVATIMLSDLIEYASGDFQPQTELVAM